MTRAAWIRFVSILLLSATALPIASHAPAQILAQEATPPGSPSPTANVIPAGTAQASASPTLIPIGSEVAGAETLTPETSTPVPETTPVAETPVGGGRLLVIPGPRVFPEGIAFREETREFFVGSLPDGSIARGQIDTGIVTPFVAGRTDAAAAGLEISSSGLLYAAGAGTGVVSVYDVATGLLLGEWTNNLAPNTFLNDVAVTSTGEAFITDSFNPILYRLPSTALPGAATPLPAPNVGQLEVFVDFTQTPFDLVQPGYNANGIVATFDGRFLLVVQSNSGSLFRIDTTSAEVVKVDLGGVLLTGGDGIALDGQRLYVVREGQIAIVELGPDFATGVTVGSFADPGFTSPTSVTVYEGCLLVVNSQLDALQGLPELPFTVSSIPVPDLTTDSESATTPVEPTC